MAAAGYGSRRCVSRSTTRRMAPARLGLGDAVRVLGLGRLVVVFVAERAHRHGDALRAAPAGAGERPGVPDRPPGLRLAALDLVLAHVVPSQIRRPIGRRRIGNRPPARAARQGPSVSTDTARSAAAHRAVCSRRRSPRSSRLARHGRFGAPRAGKTPARRRRTRAQRRRADQRTDSWAACARLAWLSRAGMADLVPRKAHARPWSALACMRTSGVDRRSAHDRGPASIPAVDTHTSHALGAERPSVRRHRPASERRRDLLGDRQHRLLRARPRARSSGRRPCGRGASSACAAGPGSRWATAGMPTSPPWRTVTSSGIPPRNSMPCLRREALAAAAPEDLGRLAAVRADERAHVLDDADDRHVHPVEHRQRLLDVEQRDVLRRRHEDRAADRDGLGERQLGVGRAGRLVDDEVVELAPVDVA